MQRTAPARVGVAVRTELSKTVREFLAGKPHGVIAVAPDDTVLQALKVMAEKDTASAA